MKRSYVPCPCGYNPYTDHDRNHDDDELGPESRCPIEDALLNHVTFPSFYDLSQYDSPSDVYHSGWETGILRQTKHWCFIGEVEDVMPPFMRSRTYVKTRFGEKTSVAFYLDNDQELPCEIMKGYTLCVLYGERKIFLDGSRGIRQEDPDFVWAFAAKFDQVQAEAQKLLKNATDATSTLYCFTCGKTAKSKCSRCKYASYCSSDCQRQGWPVHKLLCEDMKKLLGVALLPRKPFKAQLTFLVFEAGNELQA